MHQHGSASVNSVAGKRGEAGRISSPWGGIEASAPPGNSREPGPFTFPGLGGSSWKGGG